MTKTDIFSGFLGAGKTTLIRKLIAEGYKGERLVLIENEFGDIAIDGGFLKDAGVEITEMNSGCICCTLVGDFAKALEQVVKDYAPDRIIIEPSGVGKLSDVAKAVENVEGIEIGSKTTVVDAGKCKMYKRNFGEFFNDQVASADLVVLSRTDSTDEAKTAAATEIIRSLNTECGLITTPWDKISGAQILEAMTSNGLKRAMQELAAEEHHDDEHDEHDHEHHHHHDHDEHEHEHEHEHDHEHHHDHDDDEGEECSCGCGHHHHHHHADEVFESWGIETAKKFTPEEVEEALEKISDWDEYGTVLRAKGFVDGKNGEWIYFDYVPDESNVRTGEPAVTGRICVIGSKINKDALKELFAGE